MSFIGKNPSYVGKNDNLFYKVIVSIKEATGIAAESLSLTIIGDIGSVENLKLNEDLSKQFTKESKNEFEFKLLDVGTVCFRFFRTIIIFCAKLIFLKINKIKIAHDYSDRAILIESVVVKKSEISFKLF